jgi:hypothetical protein
MVMVIATMVVLKKKDNMPSDWRYSGSHSDAVQNYIAKCRGTALPLVST